LHSAGIRPKRILEIGVGTGNLTRRVLEAFPHALLVGIDVVEEYILHARQKLSDSEDRMTLLVKDVNDFEFNERYDVILTSYVFHHIKNPSQNAIYTTIYQHLNPNGLFINADFVDSSSSYFRSIFDALRMDYMRDQGIDERTIQVDYQDHKKFEIPMPLEKQMAVLSQIGFNDVECFWKYLNLAVFGAKK
jgi:tRNA (cmo5U34)-methyltransferase